MMVVTDTVLRAQALEHDLMAVLQKHRSALTDDERSRLDAIAQRRDRKVRTFVRMFKPQFAPAVELGEKLQTVRPTPKRMPRPGDRISLRAWTGAPYRSKQRVLREAVISSVSPIEIFWDYYRTMNAWGKWTWFEDRSALDAFARQDGFAGWDELTDWFSSTHRLAFRGVLICWSNE